jgi:hypothetical protein
MAMRPINRPVVQQTEDHGSHQVIHPRNVLKAKAGYFAAVSKNGDPDAMVEAAEAAIEALAPQFFFWLDESVATLVKAREALWSDGLTDANKHKFFLAAHDIRGTGATFGYALASRVAESLVYLVEKIGLDLTPRALIDQHVDAIRAIVREHAEEDNQVGTALVRQLANVTNRFIEMDKAKIAARH